MKKLFCIIALTHAALMGGARTASAEDFNYNYLKDGQIGLCTGVSLHVGIVGNVGSTRSGGAHGIDEIWGQGHPVAIGFGTRLPIDFRAQIEAGLRNYDFRKLKFDSSFARVVDPAIALMEQLKLRNSEIGVCMSRFDLAGVNQNHSVQTHVRFDLRFRVSIAFDSNEGRKTLFVQEIGGQPLIQSAFYNLYYDFSPRPYGLISQSWEKIVGNFNTLLAPVPNAEADQNLAALKAELGDVLR